MSEKRPYAYGSTLRAGGPLPRVNKERRARRESEGRAYGPHHQWIKTQPCELYNHPDHVCEFYPDRPFVEGHHLKSVGSGGEDRNTEVPLCPGGHDEIHRIGLSAMCDRYGRDFRSIAVEYTGRFDREHEG